MASATGGRLHTGGRLLQMQRGGAVRGGGGGTSAPSASGVRLRCRGVQSTKTTYEFKASDLQITGQDPKTFMFKASKRETMEVMIPYHSNLLREGMDLCVCAS